MPYKRFILTFLSLCFVLSLITATLQLTILSTPASINSKALPVIILDAGHGGFDGGAEALDGTLEKDINLAITLKLRDLLAPLGFDIVMVREEDKGIEDNSNTSIRNRKISDLNNRLKLLNKYPNSIFLSIHLNKFEQASIHGAQVFYTTNVESSKLLAEEVQTAIVKMVQPENHRKAKPASKETFLLSKAKNPAVIIECGFLSNPTDLKNLKDEEYQAKISFAIICGLLNFLKQPELEVN